MWLPTTAAGLLAMLLKPDLFDGLGLRRSAPTDAKLSKGSYRE
jgi:hypothetical protein